MLKVGYLALYNTIQWIGFIVLAVILLYLLKDGEGRETYTCVQHYAVSLNSQTVLVEHTS